MRFLASALPLDTEPAFFEHLRALDCSGVTVRALPEGSLAFPGVSAGPAGRGGAGRGAGPRGRGGRRLTPSPQVPLLQVSGPLLVVQLLETPLLCLVSYARWAPHPLPRWG